jgi:hypothetical protein
MEYEMNDTIWAACKEQFERCYFYVLRLLEEILPELEISSTHHIFIKNTKKHIKKPIIWI